MFFFLNERPFQGSILSKKNSQVARNDLPVAKNIASSSWKH